MDDEKIERYRILKNKMKSVLTKNQSLNNRISDLKSNLKMCFEVDGDIFDFNEFNLVDKNIDDLEVDVRSVISTINHMI